MLPPPPGSPPATSTRVVLIGVGGATCSGKTTLAKHLNRIIPDSVIIHQDDFAPPEDKLVIHPVYQVQDWDAAPGAIDWPRLVRFLREVKRTGQIPPDHRSHDHLNEQKDVPVGEDIEGRWKGVFEGLRQNREERGERVIWGLVDGFLLYWNQDVIDQLDVRLFLRVPHDVLKQRRDERNGYHTAGKNVTLAAVRSLTPVLPPFELLYSGLHVCPPLAKSALGEQFDAPEGTIWRDPPLYWERIVYPAYLDAHRDIFQDGDVEQGKPVTGGNGKVKGLVLIEGMEMEMSQVVDLCCKVLAEV